MWGLLKPQFESKLFHFHGEFYEQLGNLIKLNSPLVNLNPLSKNPGSAPAVPIPGHLDFNMIMKFVSW